MVLTISVDYKSYQQSKFIYVQRRYLIYIYASLFSGLYSANWELGTVTNLLMLYKIWLGFYDRRVRRY